MCVNRQVGDETDEYQRRRRYERYERADDDEDRPNFRSRTEDEGPARSRTVCDASSQQADKTLLEALRCALAPQQESKAAAKAPPLKGSGAAVAQQKNEEKENGGIRPEYPQWDRAAFDA